MAQARLVFPADFRWGTATSAYQVEGNNKNSDWWQWEQQPGAILEGHQSGRASDWWEKAEADLRRAAEMGTNAHRLSLEWSRIEPQPSVFDEAALERYRALLQTMHELDIEPMVTLHHFSNPQWLVEKGDFSSGIAVDYFQRYTAKVVDRLGDLVPLWITINEPLVYVFMRYIAGAFPPPQRKGWGAGARALRTLLRCHAAAYKTIKEKQPNAQVGVAKNMIPFDPVPVGTILDRWWAGRVSWIYNDWWMEAMQDGRLRLPFGRGEIDGLAGSFDFVGVNYYTRFYTRFPKLYLQQWGPDAIVSDGNYGEVYPEGLFRVIKHALRYQKPVYITENGVPDREDSLRPAFLLSHLREVWRGVSFNWPIMGYYHWSLVDNFEWDRGWTQRFGLLALDRKTGEREWRSSARLYGEICHSGSISSEMAQRYAPHLLTDLFPG
ncbi:MAG: family 1 glycosylhydrolase [Candidatus Promineifilaceae bacterium]|nr:family 1 glycosylhydrolase [Candidatus Promineifilaceae bacterium]